MHQWGAWEVVPPQYPVVIGPLSVVPLDYDHRLLRQERYSLAKRAQWWESESTRSWNGTKSLIGFRQCVCSANAVAVYQTALLLTGWSHKDKGISKNIRNRGRRWPYVSAPPFNTIMENLQSPHHSPGPSMSLVFLNVQTCIDLLEACTQ